MFEKAVEEYGNSFEWTNDDKVIDYSKQGFQKGAEFGYNKANEWHYVKDGDFPKEKGVYLTCRKKGFQLLAFDGAYWITGIQDDVYNTIIAWKEIVLPELPGESE